MQFFKNIKKQAGFTFIELLVVTTIILIISTIAVVSYTQAARSSRNAKRTTDLEAIRQALVLYRSENAGYPTGSDDAETVLASPLNGYLNPIPAPPQTGDVYFYSGTGTCGTSCTGFSLTTALEGDAEELYSVTNP